MSPVGRQLCHAPDGVPAHFRPRPVRVPHVHAQVGSLATGAHSHDAVASDARAAAAHAPVASEFFVTGQETSKF